jgi:hypothetical protein
LDLIVEVGEQRDISWGLNSPSPSPTSSLSIYPPSLNAGIETTKEDGKSNHERGREIFSMEKILRGVIRQASRPNKLMGNNHCFSRKIIGKTVFWIRIV